METEVKIYRCGNCGESTFKAYKSKKHFLMIECTKCKSTSIITVETPKIKIDFGENSTSRIAIF
jgi:hypothetical protein